jgi:hypothetical protein
LAADERDITLLAFFHDALLRVGLTAAKMPVTRIYRKACAGCQTI